jgi:Asp-tRNA(Asn)/Glu-tRNA(Gln) amidotransferase C subunit
MIVFQITARQLKHLNTLISKLKISKEEKESMVFGFTGGLGISSKDLNELQADEMIKYLMSLDPTDVLRKKIFALAYEAELIYGDSPEDKKMNAAKINQLLLKSGTVKKELNNMTRDELVKVVSQFQQIVKHINQSKASKVTKSLLDELNISIAKTKALT